MRRLTLPLVSLALIAAACGSASETDTTATETDAAETAATETTEAPATTAAETTVAPTTTAAETTAPPETTPPPAIPSMQVSFDGLVPLGDGGDYELWFIDADGNPISGGVFDTDAGTSMEFELPDGVPEAVEVKVSIETDDDPAPSSTIVLSGAFDGSSAALVADIADFSDASGQYILATPTDGTGSAENERAGVWWTAIPRAQSLFLPELSEGWEYEMWQVIDGQALTGGKFTDPFAPDQAAPFSGPDPAPPLVGEDYLINAPDGFTFPVDLRGMEVFISVEPIPDPNPAESSGIVPLSGIIPADAIDHTHYFVDNVSDSRVPSGTLSISEG